MVPLEEKEDALVLYFSLTGNCELLARAIGDATGIPVERLEPVKPLPMIDPEKNSKYFWGGYLAMVGKKPPIKPLAHDVSGVSLLFLASPVWAWRPNPVLRTFLDTHDLSGKKVALCLSSGTGSSPKAIQRHAAALPAGAELVDVIEFKEPKSTGPDEAARRVSEWARGILSKQA